MQDDYYPPAELFEPLPNPAEQLRTLVERRSTRKREHVPTPQLRQAVERAYAFGLTQMQVAHMLGISINLLKRHYIDELADGPAILQSALMNGLVNIALDATHKQQAPTAQWLLARRFGMTEKTAVELTGRDGGALQIESAPTTIDPRRLTPEQRDNLRELLALAVQPALEDHSEEAEYEEIEDE